MAARLDGLCGGDIAYAEQAPGLWAGLKNRMLQDNTAPLMGNHGAGGRSCGQTGVSFPIQEARGSAWASNNAPAGRRSPSADRYGNPNVLPKLQMLFVLVDNDNRLAAKAGSRVMSENGRDPEGEKGEASHMDLSDFWL